MARSRLIKPDFFVDEDMAQMGPLARLLFVGLWTLADKEGRLEDRPQRIKAQLLPYDRVDANTLLVELAAARFLVRYEVDGKRYIQIRSFGKHQNPHPKEPTLCPAPSDVPVTPPTVDTTANVEVAQKEAENEEAISLHGEKFLTATRNVQTPLTLPSSSSSSFSSSPLKAPQGGPGSSGFVYPPEFEAIWAPFPRIRGTKHEAFERWQKLKPRPAVAVVLAAIEDWRRCDDWTKDAGAFIPAMARWLKTRGFETPAPSRLARASPSVTRVIPPLNGQPLCMYHATLDEKFRNECPKRCPKHGLPAISPGPDDKPVFGSGPPAG